MSLKATSLITKFILLLSVVALFIWTIPNIVNYYTNLKSYRVKEKKLDYMYDKNHIISKAEEFTLDSFKKSANAIFSDVSIKQKKEQEYEVSIEVVKDKLDSIYTFIKTISLNYLVTIKDNELKFEDKKQFIEVTFIVEKL